MEKQDSDVAKRALTEAHERNEDLLKRNEDLLKRNDDLIKKIEESGKVITHLQESLQRCICIFYVSFSKNTDQVLISIFSTSFKRFLVILP
jgi:hypothetical protein